MRRGFWGLLPFLLLVISTAGLAAQGPTPSADSLVVWSGEIHLTGPTHVPADTTLRIEPGTRITPAPISSPLEAGQPSHLVVHGDLLVPGGPEPPTEFRVPVTIMGEGPGPTIIEEASFHPSVNASCALRVSAGGARIQSSSFTGARNGFCLGEGAPASDPNLGEVNRRSAHVLPPGYVSEVERGDVGPSVDGIASEHEPWLESPASPAVPPSAAILTSNRYVGNSEAGLHLTGPPAGSSTSRLHVLSDDSLVAGNDIGIHIGPGAVHLEFSNGTIQDNRIGLLSEGGSTEFDHTTFQANRDWDVYNTGEPGDIRWSGSSFEPSCVYTEGRDGYGCQRGSIGGVTVLTILLGLLYGLAFLLSELGQYLLTRLWLWLRLYSRIPRDEVLEHETRQMLLELVRKDPGRHLRDLAKEVGSYGRTVHHLRRLEDENFLRSQHEGRYLRFYPIDVDPDDREPKSTREHVFATIETTPGIYAAEIARRIDTSRQLVSYHVRHLLDVGKVTAEVDDRVNRLYPAGGREAKRDSDVP